MSCYLLTQESTRSISTAPKTALGQTLTDMTAPDTARAPAPGNRALDVVTVGETMILVAPTDLGSVETAQAFTLHVGGAESNVAVHLHHLGHRVLWLGAVGDDPLGKRLLHTLRHEGLDVSHVTIDPIAPTGLYVKDPGQGVYYYRGGSAASQMGPDAVSDDILQRASIIHLTGITPALSEGCRALSVDVARRAKQAGVLVSVDVNYRPALWPVDIASTELVELCRLADIVFVGLDEAHTLWGARTPADIRALLPDVPRLVVKNDAVGAVEFDGDTETFVASISVDVVEPVGAGDAFAAGYLSGSLQGLASELRLQLGHERAARTLRTVSDFPAPPSEGVS